MYLYFAKISNIEDRMVDHFSEKMKELKLIGKINDTRFFVESSIRLLQMVY
jgi:hypothetical protein